MILWVYPGIISTTCSRSPLTKLTAKDISVVAPTIRLDKNGAVVMTTPTAGAQIRYTTDGTRPNAGSMLYTGAEYLPGDCVLRAVSIHGGKVSPETTAYLSEYGDLYFDIRKGQWFYDAMDWAHREGILNGTAAYTMDPAGVVTRGMLVTLLYRFGGDWLEDGWTRTNRFADVDQKAYYAEAIEWAFRRGIVDGYAETAFGPDDPVTRQQMCKIVAGFLDWACCTLHPAAESASGFADWDQVADWAAEPLEDMIAAGLIQGDGIRLNPNANANRAQFCVLLLRLETYIEEYVPYEPEPEEPPVPSEPVETTAPTETILPVEP